MRVPHRTGGSGWHFRSELGADALCPKFAGFESVAMGWCATRGRCVLTTRTVSRGELIMNVPALGHVRFDRVQPSAMRSYELEELGLDDATLALSRSVLENQACHSIVEALVAPRLDATAMRRVAARLRASPLPPTMSGLDDGRLVGLCLRVKCNLHMCHDDETAHTCEQCTGQARE